MSSDVQAFFRRMDQEFIGHGRVADEEFIYRASDVLVQATWELPIVVQWPGSTVTYEFSSTPGDISFGIVFVAAPDTLQEVEDLDIETVEEMSTAPSHTEDIAGSFELPSEGVVFFLWDNNFDWSAVKKISYTIRVLCPSFSLPDQERSTSASAALKEVVEDLDAAYVRRADAQDLLEHNSANTVFLSDQIALLAAKLTARQTALAELTAMAQAAEHSIAMASQCAAGLCMRSLSKALLGCVLSYLPPHLPGGVCRYWHEVVRHPPEEVRGRAVINARDRARMLFEIRYRTPQGVAAGDPATPGTSEEVQSLKDEGVQHRSASSATSSEVEGEPLISYRTVRPQQEAATPPRTSSVVPVPVPLHKVPAVAEEKARARGSKGVRGGHKLVMDVQQIRSQQQMRAVVEHMSAQQMKIEGLANEKRRVKKLIRAWNASYERQHGRLPGSGDRKGHLRELHEEYQQLALSLRIRREKMDDALRKVGMTLEQVQQLQQQMR